MEYSIVSLIQVPAVNMKKENEKAKNSMMVDDGNANVLYLPNQTNEKESIKWQVTGAITSMYRYQNQFE